MLSYLQQFVNNLNKPKYYLILANFLLVFFLILVSNLGMLPMKTSDFAFFSIILLIFALYRPGWSFLIFVGLIALENINLAPKGFGIAIRPYQFFGAMTALAVLGRIILKRSNINLPKLKWFDYVLLLFVVSGFVSALAAANKSLSLKQAVVSFTFLILYFLVRTFIQNVEDVKKIIPFFLSSSVVVVFYGIFQNIRFMRGLNPFEAMPGRPNSTFTESDWLGIFLVILIAVIYVIIYQISNNQFPISNKISNFKFQISNSSYWLLITSYLFLIPVFILLIITVSRSSWLGAWIVTTLFLIAVLKNFTLPLRNWNWKPFLKILRIIAIAIIGSILIVYVFQLTNFQLFNRVQSTGSGLQEITIACDQNVSLPEKINDVSELEQYGCRHINLEDIGKEKAAGNFVSTIYRVDPNVSLRSGIYQKSIEQIKEHPILGIGWGTISQILGTDERGAGLNASNIFLEVWLGSGIIGLLAFLTILAYAFVKSLKLYYNGDLENKIFGLFMILSLFGFLIPNLFNSGIFLGILWVWLGVILSVSSRTSSE